MSMGKNWELQGMSSAEPENFTLKKKNGANIVEIVLEHRKWR